MRSNEGKARIVSELDDPYPTVPRLNGYSMLQLIETSLISAHFVEAGRTIYLDVFSGAPDEPKDVPKFALDYYRGNRNSLRVAQRK